MDIKVEQLNKLKQLFPEVFTEGTKIDWEKLKLTLGEAVDTVKERYGMNWPGKADCFKTIQQPSIATLIPDREESVNFDSTENLFIEGDNLEVLKLLQKSYIGKIKMIYIDPPYNTGNEFIYPDNYSESLDTYLEYTGQIDSEGRKFSTNADTDGRFHSKWMSMMYPRLFLAKNLLRKDGMIFISIDDNEYHNLRFLCNEVFGEENFVDNIIWKKRYGGGAKEKFLVSLHEYIIVYAKNKGDLNPIFIPNSLESIQRYYTKKDANFDIRGPYRTHPLEATKSMGDRKNLTFSITAPDGTQVLPKRQWLWSKERASIALINNELEFLKDKDGGWSVHTKQYLYDEEGKQRESKAFSIIDDVYTQHGTNEVLDILGNAQIFSFPKPTELIKKLINIGSETKDEIILDLFSGSCSSAHATIDQNQQDGGVRKFICVQLPEPVEEGSEAFKAGYKTIADIGKERIRRVIKKLNEEQNQKEQEEQNTPNIFEQDAESKQPKQDLGFKVFKLQKSNFNLWNADIEKTTDAIQEQLALHVKHILPKAEQESILYELLLKSGFSLTTRIEKIELNGKQVFSIEDGDLLICLEKELTHELIKAMAERKPIRVICLDEGFQNNDQLKANAVLIMKTNNVLKFQTV